MLHNHEYVMLCVCRYVCEYLYQRSSCCSRCYCQNYDSLQRRYILSTYKYYVVDAKSLSDDAQLVEFHVRFAVMETN